MSDRPIIINVNDSEEEKPVGCLELFISLLVLLLSAIVLGLYR